MKKHIWISILILIPLRAMTSGNDFPLPDSILVSDSSVLPGPVPANNIAMEYNIAGETVKAYISSNENKYPVQLGAFRFKLNADAFYREVLDRVDLNAIMVKEGGLYKIRISRSPVPGKISKRKLEAQAGPSITEAQDTVQNHDTIKTAAVIADSSVIPTVSTGFELIHRAGKWQPHSFYKQR